MEQFWCFFSEGVVGFSRLLGKQQVLRQASSHNGFFMLFVVGVIAVKLASKPSVTQENETPTHAVTDENASPVKKVNRPFTQSIIQRL